jgi:hypothetical protein
MLKVLTSHSLYVAAGTNGVRPVILRCLLDGLVLPATLDPATGTITAYDGDDGFDLEAVEAIHYELLAADPDEALLLEGRYRLLRKAHDFCSLCPICPRLAG